MMADDFWAPESWKHVYREMKRVFPELEPRELSRDHEIFNIVYEIQGVPQGPRIFAWNQGSTFEYWHGDPQGDEAPHFWGFFDQNDRLMALLCHNNDIGDGWEREGESVEAVWGGVGLGGIQFRGGRKKPGCELRITPAGFMRVGPTRIEFI